MKKSVGSDANMMRYLMPNLRLSVRIKLIP